MELSAQFGHAGIQRGDLAVQFFDGSFMACGLGLDGLTALPGTLEFAGGFVDAETAVLALVFQNRDFALAASVGLGHGADISIGLLDLQDKLLGLFTQGGAFFVELVQLAAQTLVVGLGSFKLALLVAHGIVGAADGIDPEGDFQAFTALGQFQELLGLFAVALQGADALFQFAQNIAKTFEVALGGFKATLGFVFAVAVFGNAGRFLENFAALGRFGTDDLGNAALADDGVTVAANAGIQQQFVDVLQTDVLAVDGILALAAAVVTAANGDFVSVHIQTVVAVVDGQRDRGKAHGTAALGAAEDDVLHFAGAAQLLGAGLAQHPADGVGNIRFAGAVRPDHAGDTLADGDFRFIGEGFETLDFQFFQAHVWLKPFA